MIKFELLNDKDKLPYDLLLLVDETKDTIDKYVYDSDVFLAKINDNIIGAFCLLKLMIKQLN